MECFHSMCEKSPKTQFDPKYFHLKFPDFTKLGRNSLILFFHEKILRLAFCTIQIFSFERKSNEFRLSIATQIDWKEFPLKNKYSNWQRSKKRCQAIDTLTSVKKGKNSEKILFLLTIRRTAFQFNRAFWSQENIISLCIFFEAAYVFPPDYIFLSVVNEKQWKDDFLLYNLSRTMILQFSCFKCFLWLSQRSDKRWFRWVEWASKSLLCSQILSAKNGKKRNGSRP